MPKNPVRTSKKAVKKAGKALSVFEASASALEAASAHHLAAADGYEARAAALAEQVDANYERALLDAEAAYNAAVTKADQNVSDGYGRVLDLDDLAVKAEEDAYAAQVQADSFRQLLAVA